MTQPMRIIQAGMGGFGSNWYTTKVGPSPDVQAVGFVDASPEARERCIEKLGIARGQLFETLDEAMAQVDAGAVLITASLPGHVPLATAAIEAGKHVLMEKPFAPSVASARELVRRAEAAGVTLMISQNYRFFPAPQAAAAVVRDGVLGALGVVHVDFRRDHVAFDEGRRRHYELPHPLLADMAIHHFDLLRMITGKDANRVRCYAFHPPWSHYSDPPSAEAVVEMDGGPVVTYRGSWVSSGPITPWAGEWHLEFEQGELWFQSRGDDTANSDELWIKRLGEKANKQKLPKLTATDRAGSLREFVRSIRDGRQPITPGSLNIGSIGLTYAAIEASETEGWVTVER